MLWLHLHFPQLLLDHIRRSRQQDAALVIVDASGQKVLQACAQASSQGVQPGMRLKTALSLVADLAMVRTDPQQEARVLQDQARWLYRCAAHITLVPPDGLLAEIGSLQKLYGGLPAVWETVEQGLNERRLTAWLGIGNTPLAARLIARTGKGECSADHGHMQRLLDQLPLPAAEFDTQACTRLQRLGLNTLSDLFALPAADLARRLGPKILAHSQKIQGTRPDPQQPWQPPHRFRQQADFVEDIEHSQGLLFPLQRILSELEEDLCWRQQETDSLNLLLCYRYTEPTRLHIRTSGPEHRAEAFLNLIRLRFEQQPLQAPVVSLVLLVKRFIGREATSGQDLLGETQDLNEAWHTLISRLQARLGDDALQQLAPNADHRPEQAWASAGVQRKQRKASAEKNPLPCRPLWLMRKPQPLHTQPQAWFSGPERISGGWWDGQRVQRDYYIAQLPNGQLAWVFRDASQGWHIHGWFG
jgi:protein ImuB